MVTFSEMTNVSVLVEVFATAVAILGIVQVVFRSKIGEYVATLLQREIQKARSQLASLGESTKKRIVDPETQSERIVADPEVLSVVRPQIKRLRRKLIVWDGVMYLLSCVFCQSAWIAMGIYGVLELFEWFNFVLTVAFYALLCAWLHERLQRDLPVQRVQHGRCGR